MFILIARMVDSCRTSCGQCQCHRRFQRDGWHLYRGGPQRLANITPASYPTQHTQAVDLNSGLSQTNGDRHTTGHGFRRRPDQLPRCVETRNVLLPILRRLNARCLSTPVPALLKSRTGQASPYTYFLQIETMLHSVDTTSVKGRKGISPGTRLMGSAIT